MLDRILGLLHPFMPFITEELWQLSGAKRLLALSDWPAPAFEDEAAADEMNWLIELIAAIRSVRSEMNVPPGAMLPITISGASPKTTARLRTQDAVLRRLARIETIGFSDAPQKGSIQILVREATISMPLAGIIDLAAERGRLARELDKLGKDIAKIEAQARQCRIHGQGARRGG